MKEVVKTQIWQAWKATWVMSHKTIYKQWYWLSRSEKLINKQRQIGKSKWGIWLSRKRSNKLLYCQSLYQEIKWCIKAIVVNWFTGGIFLGNTRWLLLLSLPCYCRDIDWKQIMNETTKFGVESSNLCWCNWVGICGIDTALDHGRPKFNLKFSWKSIDHQKILNWREKVVKSYYSLEAI